VAFALAAAACGGDDSASGSAGATASEGGSRAASADPCGFDPALVEAARAEGDILVTGAPAESDGIFLGDLFKETYGIGLTYNRQPTADAVQQIEASLEANAVRVDAVLLAEPSAFVTWTEKGLLAELDVPNADKFVPGIRDESRMSIPYVLAAQGVTYNSSKFDKEELPKTWDELVTTRDGKVFAFANPANSGSGLSFHHVMQREVGEDYMASFAGTKNLVTESALTLNQMVLTGEADFGMPGIESEAIKAQEAGEPFAIFYLDVVPVGTAEAGALVGGPKPNAGKLFAQFTTCQIVQDRINEIGFRSVLTDVPPPEGLEDVSAKKQVPVDVAMLMDTRAEVIARFDEGTKG
jgi:iron(III) transport system substrate-binding protein